MKLKSKLSFIILAVSLVFIIFYGTGCRDSSSGSSYCHNCEVYRNRITSLEKKNKTLTENLNSVIAERDKAEESAYKRYIILSIIAYVVLGIGILLVGGFILMVRSSKKNMPKLVVDNLRCPRCGWEHAAGETICKNCKTHF